MKQLTKGLVLGAAAGALFVGCSVPSRAADDMSSTMTTTTTMAMAPTAVSGKVVRYYIDRSGFVTAADVQTADGVRMVRFSPSMAQRMVSTYPVGTDTTVYVTSTPIGATTRYDVVSLGADMPTPSAMMMPYTVTDLDLLRSNPYTVAGAKTMRVTGKITNYVTDPQTTEVLALILDGNTLIRVPRENRLMQASPAPEGVTPLFKGGWVEAFGYPEAPRYGAVTPYPNRLIATGISVNGNSLGPLGFGALVGGDPTWVTASKDTYYQYNRARTDVIPAHWLRKGTSFDSSLFCLSALEPEDSPASVNCSADESACWHTRSFAK